MAFFNSEASAMHLLTRSRPIFTMATAMDLLFRPAIPAALTMGWSVATASSCQPCLSDTCEGPLFFGPPVYFSPALRTVSMNAACAPGSIRRSSIAPSVDLMRSDVTLPAWLSPTTWRTREKRRSFREMDPPPPMLPLLRASPRASPPPRNELLPPRDRLRPPPPALPPPALPPPPPPPPERHLPPPARDMVRAPLCLSVCLPVCLPCLCGVCVWFV